MDGSDIAYNNLDDLPEVGEPASDDNIVNTVLKDSKSIAIFEIIFVDLEQQP